MPWFLVVLISLAVEVIAYLIMPKPHAGSGNTQIQAPTADASRPVPVPFGTLTIDGTNVLWYGDVQSKQYTVSA